MCSSSGGLEPVLVDFNLNRICVLPGIVGPDVDLTEAHTVEGLGWQAGTAVGQFFWIGVRAKSVRDHAKMSTDVSRRPHMSGRPRLPHQDPIAGRKARVSRRGAAALIQGCYSAEPRASTAAILRPSSSLVTTPRSIMAAAMAAIQRSY